jgi:two-component system LytT family response regulator
MTVIPKLRCVVLEDEDDIRNWLVSNLTFFPALEIVGDAATLDDAFALIVQQKPDAAFMDIRMIGGDAFSLMSRLQSRGVPLPYLVITTGYPEDFLKSFNNFQSYIVHYIEKPFLEAWEDKFQHAVDSLMARKMKDTDQAHAAQNTSVLEDHLFVMSRGSYVRVDFDNIAYLEAAGGGETIIVTDTGTLQADVTLAKCLDILPEDRFARISRANIANVRRIMVINREERTVEVRCDSRNKSLGVGDAYYADLLKRVNKMKT